MQLNHAGHIAEICVSICAQVCLGQFDRCVKSCNCSLQMWRSRKWHIKSLCTHTHTHVQKMLDGMLFFLCQIKIIEGLQRLIVDLPCFLSPCMLKVET